MFIKIFSAIALTGALWVGGDAAFKSVGFRGSECASPRECCLVDTKAKTDDCCSNRSSCCSAKSTTTAAAVAHCCDAEYVYCTQTGAISEGCCCVIIDGQFFCLITGTVSDEYCCIPLD